VRTATLVELSGELPNVIILVDRADRAARIIPQLTAMVRLD
jgi:PII-like signaling protein